VTLKSVAARIRHVTADHAEGRYPEAWELTKELQRISNSLESDPEFTAPERLKEAERHLAEAREKLARVEKPDDPRPRLTRWDFQDGICGVCGEESFASPSEANEHLRSHPDHTVTIRYVRGP
jgi:hypothetical protein